MEKVIIIGAGPAGLTAAIELLKNGGDYDVTILEGSQAMGGISQTVRYNGNRMDIGGHRFFSKNQQVMDWWADLMPLQGKPAYDDKKLGHEKPLAENGPDPETEDLNEARNHKEHGLCHHHESRLQLPLGVRVQKA